MRNLPLALAGFLGEHGGEIRTRARVDKILVEHGRAVAVRLADGDVIDVGQLVASNIDPQQLALNLLGDDVVGPKIAGKMRRYELGESVLVIYLALDRPVHYKAGELVGRGLYAHPAAPSLDAFSRQFQECRGGLLPSRPFALLCNDSAADPGRVPAGKALMKLVVQPVPYRIEGDAGGTITGSTWQQVEGVLCRSRHRPADRRLYPRSARQHHHAAWCTARWISRRCCRAPRRAPSRMAPFCPTRLAPCGRSRRWAVTNHPSAMCICADREAIPALVSPWPRDGTPPRRSTAICRSPLTPTVIPLPGSDRLRRLVHVTVGGTLLVSQQPTAPTSATRSRRIDPSSAGLGGRFRKMRQPSLCALPATSRVGDRFPPCRLLAGRSHPTHLESVSRNRRLDRAPPGHVGQPYALAVRFGRGESVDLIGDRLGLSMSQRASGRSFHAPRWSAARNWLKRNGAGLEW